MKDIRERGLYILLAILMCSDTILTEYAIRVRKAKEINPLLKDPNVRIAIAVLKPFLPLSLYTIRKTTGWKWLDYQTLGLNVIYSIAVGNNIYQLLKKE